MELSLFRTCIHSSDSSSKQFKRSRQCCAPFKAFSIWQRGLQTNSIIKLASVLSLEWDIEEIYEGEQKPSSFSGATS